MADACAIIRGEVKDETTMNPHDKKARANALFEGEKQQKGREAMTEYQAQQTAVRERRSGCEPCAWRATPRRRQCRLRRTSKQNRR
jgi:hypothetical protein